MPADVSFKELIARVRRGDPKAIEQLVKDYTPKVIRAVRFRLDSRHRRILDSMDIVQSVMVEFCHRASRGEFELGEPRALEALLATMACNHVISKVRNAAIRDYLACVNIDDPGQIQEATHSPEAADPQDMLQRVQDMLQRVRPLFDNEEWALLKMREVQGLEWEEIAEALGGKAAALRQRLHRALERVQSEFACLEDDGE